LNNLKEEKEKKSSPEDELNDWEHLLDDD